MKISTIVTIAAAGFVSLFAISSYNGIAKMDQNVQNSVAQIQTQLQRTADLVPNLMTVVDRYANHEKDTLKQVTEARAGMTSVAKMNPEELSKNPELQKQVIEAQSQMSQAMVKVSMLREAYPELKANTMFTNLMVEMTGSINRISDARRKSQNVITEYNSAIVQFPRVIFAKLFGFSTKPYFEAADDAKTVQKFQFDSTKK